MRPLPHAMLLLMAAALTATRVTAQLLDPPPASPATDSAPAANTPTPSAAPAPDRARPVSPAIAAHLADKMPKFAPPTSARANADTTPVLADAKSAPPPADLRDLDRPRNPIIRLPNYVVQEEKPPAFKERHLLTPKGRLELGLKRYPGLRFGSLPIFSNHGWALAMLEEDYRLERKAEMEDLVTLAADSAERARTKTEVQKAFLRSDW